MGYNIENVTKEDIEILTKYDATFEELISARNFSKRIEYEVFTSNNEMWNKINLVLYSYKLGQMQGKREERARKGKGNI